MNKHARVIASMSSITALQRDSRQDVGRLVCRRTVVHSRPGVLPVSRKRNKHSMSGRSSHSAKCSVCRLVHPARASREDRATLLAVNNAAASLEENKVTVGLGRPDVVALRRPRATPKLASDERSPVRLGWECRRFCSAGRSAVLYPWRQRLTLPVAQPKACFEVAAKRNKESRTANVVYHTVCPASESR